MVRVIHQENRGHGGAINTGLAHAGGAFVKVVDSDDWVDGVAYARILGALKNFPETARPDVVISNYVYEKAGRRRKMAIRYSRVMPEGRIFTWAELGVMPKGRYILMHAIIYRRDILNNCGLRLPEHTFYVDNLYAYIPLRYTTTLYYLNLDFYRYYIGRAGQSVQEEVMIRRIDQQLFVNRLMVAPQKKAINSTYGEPLVSENFHTEAPWGSPTTPIFSLIMCLLPSVWYFAFHPGEHGGIPTQPAFFVSIRCFGPVEAV
jgi:glycosyltransferase involved in cell wall biosynthesis